MLAESEAAIQPRSKLDIFRNAAFNIASAPGTTVMAFDSVVTDSLNEWEGAPTYTFRPKHAGFYIIITQLRFNAAANDWVELDIFQDAATEIARATRFDDALDTSSTLLTAATMRYLTPSNTIHVLAFWSPGPGNKAITTGRQNTFLCIARVS